MTTIAPPSPTETFVLDSNIFIEAKQRYYAFDVCPGFWDALIWQHGRGLVVSIDRVKKELKDCEDELTHWACNQMPNECFIETDSEYVLEAYREVIEWVMAQDQFTPEAKAEFADLENADAWVIAFAKAVGGKVVTHEKPRPDAKRRVPIPNVCDGVGVLYTDTFEMLRTLTTQFSWQQPSN
jgi:hypothetical protein